MDTWTNSHTKTAARNILDHDSKQHTSMVNKSFIDQPEPLAFVTYEEPAALSEVKDENPLMAELAKEPENTDPVESQSAHIAPTEAQSASIDPIEAKYEVTAYYLNVREQADSTSKIINVVQKGSILDVLSETGNGWLQLKNEGYIHGSYAKKLSEDANRPPVQVAQTADKQAAEQAVAAIPSPPQPALQAELQVKSTEPKKPNATVKSDSGLTEEQISKIIQNTALEGEGLEQAILEIEKTYGINSYFTIAVMKLESGHGKSQLARNKNNLFGLNAIDNDSYNSALSFTTKGESVKEFGHIISEFYIEQGFTSIEKIARKYCGANSNWPSLVMSIMNGDYKKVI
ncbi:glucosaminidase domain-containing protein [Paenibacillus thalictri]|nr:glucosaminidase domain-containing protein [Paenibacillus thalictri]